MSFATDNINESYVIKKGNLFYNCNYYAAFPYMYYNTDSNAIVVNFSLRKKRSHHTKPDSVIFMQSKDGGETWEPLNEYKNIPPNPDRQTRIGSISYHTIFQYPIDEKKRDYKLYFQTRVQNDYYDYFIDTLGFVMSLGNASQITIGDTVISAFYYKNSRNKYFTPIIFYSYNGGLCWNYYCLPPNDTLGWSEVAIENINESTIIALLRPDPDTIGCLFLSFSHNTGKEWQIPLQTNILGYPADILQITDGVLVAVVGRRSYPTGIYMYLSDDGGISWYPRDGLQLRISDDPNSIDLGYPQLSFLSNGNLFIVYYITDKKNCTYIEYQLVNWSKLRTIIKKSSINGR